MRKVKELPTGKELLWSAAREIRSLRYQRNLAVMGLLLTIVMLCFAGAVSAQEKTPPAAQDKSEKSAPSADKPVAVPVPAEIQELLADRALLVEEIERIATASGPAVKIPVSLRELQARLKSKTDRYLAWLDTNKIPREWSAAGWRLDKWEFIPPATPVPVAPARPETERGASTPAPNKPEGKP